MSYDINPRVDLAFKKIFGVEENKDLTISLINSIVSEEDQIKDLTLLNPYNSQNFAQDKLSILDIKARGHDGKLFNIEIQITDEADYEKRALYYWARLYTQQLKTGEEYGSLSKAIGIHILNFNSIDKSEKYHNVFAPAEKELGFNFYDDMEIHTIELNKFEANLPKELQDFMGKIKNSLDVWSSFLTRHDLMNIENLPKELDNPELKKALDVLDHINFGEEEREAYENRLQWLRIETNTLKKKYNEGLTKGKEEGLKEGEARGEARGIEKGKEEGIKEGEAKGIEKGKGETKSEIAQSLLKEGAEISLISKVTGLSESEIKTLEATPPLHIVEKT